MTQRDNVQTAEPPQRTTALPASHAGQASSSHGNGSFHRGRKATRIPVTLPLVVRDQFGGREETRTQFVMLRGAIFALAANVRIGHKLTIENSKAGKSAECHVIGMEPVSSGTHQIEVEFTSSQPDFWPVQFPEDEVKGLQASGADHANFRVEHVPEPGEGALLPLGSELSNSRGVSHNEKIISLAEPIAGSFNAHVGHVSARQTLPSRSTDSVAQFRAANRAAHRRQQHMRWVWYVIGLLAVAFLFHWGKLWLSNHPDAHLSIPTPSMQAKARANATPAPSDSAVPSAAPVAGNELPEVASPANTSEAANPTEIAAPDAASTTEVAVHHGSSVKAARTASEDAGEDPVALPLRTPISDSRSALLSSVVSTPAKQAAILAPEAMVQKKSTPARLISSVPPQYPAMARQFRLEGQVVVTVEVDTAGNVVSAKAISGPPMLRQAALDAVRRWKYAPATLGDKPVNSVDNVRVDFKFH
ncbi:MAG TPA: energy transducer TonB [Terriglobales bacterium]|nr:energy transducer TonB [Terriglobales bacterium]